MNDVIPLTADIVFKYVLGSKESESTLKSFLSAVQQDAGFPAIRDVEITNPFNLQQFTGDKTSIIDVRARDEADRQYNVEVQVRSQRAFAERTLYYWAKSYAGQLEEGHDYTKLRRVVGVSVLGFRQFPSVARAHTCFLLQESRDPELILTEDCILHYLEVTKVQGKPLSQMERWLYYLKNGPMEDETMKVLLDEDRSIREAHERYRHFVETDETREAYEARMKFLRDHATDIVTAREEGREEGIEEGRRESMRDVARRLKQIGTPIPQIAEATGLSREQIEEL